MKSETGKMLLAAGGTLNLLIAVLHLVIILLGPEAYEYFGAGQKMADMAELGSVLPSIVTVFLAIMFTVFGLYAFSAAGFFRKLPFTRLVINGIIVIFLLRALLLYEWLTNIEGYPIQNIFFSIVALIIALLYLLGWRSLRNNSFS